MVKRYTVSNRLLIIGKGRHHADELELVNVDMVLASDFKTVQDGAIELAQELNSRIAQLEAALTKFLVWNGTDYANDEAREYALVGICEEAYQLVPASASETDCNHGQVVQNGCPHCERKIGYKLESDDTVSYEANRGAKHG